MYAYTYVLDVHNMQGNDIYQHKDNSGRKWEEQRQEIRPLIIYVTVCVWTGEKGRPERNLAKVSISGCVNK